MGSKGHRFKSYFPDINMVNILYEFNAGIILKGNDIKKIKLGLIEIKKTKILKNKNFVIILPNKEKRILLLKKKEISFIKKLKNITIKVKNFALIKNLIKVKIIIEKKITPNTKKIIKNQL